MVFTEISILLGSMFFGDIFFSTADNVLSFLWRIYYFALHRSPKASGRDLSFPDPSYPSFLGLPRGEGEGE